MLVSIHPACPHFSCKGMGGESAFFSSVLPSSFFTKLLLFYSLCALGGSMNELLVCKGFRTSLLQLFSSDGRPRLLEVQLSHPSLVLAVRIPAFPMAPRLMYPVSPFECTGADLPCLWETLEVKIFKVKGSQSIIFTLMDLWRQKSEREYTEFAAACVLSHSAKALLCPA